MQQRWPLEKGDVVAFKTSPAFVDHLWEVFGPLLSGERPPSYTKHIVYTSPLRWLWTLQQLRDEYINTPRCWIYRRDSGQVHCCSSGLKAGEILTALRNFGCFTVLAAYLRIAVLSDPAGLQQFHL